MVMHECALRGGESRISKKIASTILLIVSTLIFTENVARASEQDAKAGGSESTQQQAFEVAVEIIKRNPVRETLSAHAQLLPHQISYLNPQITGMVTEIKSGFEAGRRVKKGEILLQLDQTDFRYNLAKAKQTLAAARLKLVEQEALSERAIAEWQAHNAKVPSGLAAREPQVNAAKAEIEAAGLLVAQAERDLAATSVRSPFDGWVVKRNASLGNMVSTEISLAELIPADKVVVRLPLSHSQVDRIISFADASQVSVELFSINSSQQVLTGFQGLSLGSMIEDSTGQVFAEAVINVESGVLHLRPGALLEARVYTGRSGNYFAIPQSAINDKGNIFVLRDNIVTELAIEKQFGLEEYWVVEIPGLDQVALVSAGVRQIWNGMPAHARVARND